MNKKYFLNRITVVLLAGIVALIQISCGNLNKRECSLSNRQEEKTEILQEKAIRPGSKKKFKEVKRLYDNKEYLKATDALLDLIMLYPNYDPAKRLYEKITHVMNKIAYYDGEFDFEKLIYAKAYVAYYNMNYKEALCEWNKNINFTGGTEEIMEYSEKTKALLKVEQLEKRKIDLNEKVKKILEDGIKKYNSKHWTQCIKEMEKIINLIVENGFSKTSDYYVKAKEYISKSSIELTKTLPAKNKTDCKKIYECDRIMADKKYRDGLVLYANGKYYEAERLWELTLRLNPHHQKARIAIAKLKNS